MASVMACQGGGGSILCSDRVFMRIFLCVYIFLEHASSCYGMALIDSSCIWYERKIVSLNFLRNYTDILKKLPRLYRGIVIKVIVIKKVIIYVIIQEYQLFSWLTSFHPCVSSTEFPPLFT